MDLARGILFHKILNVMSFLFHEPLASTSSMVEHISNSVAAMYPGRAIERRALSQSPASLPQAKRIAGKASFAVRRPFRDAGKPVSGWLPAPEENGSFSIAERRSR
jgi:hypothetical protein